MGERREVARAGRAIRGRAGGRGVGVRPVKATPFRREELVVDRLAEQRVPERVAPAADGRRRPGRSAATRSPRRAPRSSPSSSIPEHRSEQVVVDGAAGHRGRREESARGLRQRADPPQQDVPQPSRQRRPGQPNPPPAAPRRRTGCPPIAGRSRSTSDGGTGRAVDGGDQLVRHLGTVEPRELDAARREAGARISASHGRRGWRRWSSSER